MRLIMTALAIVLCGLAIAYRTFAADEHCVSKAGATTGCTDKCVNCPEHQCCTSKCGCDKKKCQPPCDTPCRPSGPPRKAVPRRGSPPSNDVPGVPREAFVTPPTTGVIEGPSRGVEWGGMGVTFPEMSFSLPKFRFSGLTRTASQARMRTDSAIAPLMPNPHYSQALAARGAMPGMAMIGMPVGVGYGGVGGGTRGAEQIDDEEEEEDGEEEEEQPRGASKQSCRSSRDAEPNCSKKRASRECSEDERIENLQTQVQKLSEAVGALTNALNKGENGGGVVERPGKNEKPLPRRNVDLQLIPEPQFDDRNADHPVQPLPPTEFRAEGEELRQASFIRPISITRVPAGRWGLERLPSVGP